MIPEGALELRPATPADLEPLVAAVGGLPLFARYGVDASSLRPSLALALGRGEGLIVAAVAGAPVGFAWFLDTGTFAAGGYLRLIAVAPDHQGDAIGARLLDAVERRVAERSRDLFLLVSDFNLAAQRFYARRGYRPVGALPAFVRPDVQEQIYWKRLR